jgi:hypothetical protein
MRMLTGSPVDPDERLEEFLRYWRRARGNRPMPRRADIDPTEVPPRLLPNIFLTDVIDGGARFRFRLVGTAAVAGIGADLTGRHVDEVNRSTPYRDYITGLYRRVVAERLPVFSMSHFFKVGEAQADYHATQRLMCPLSTDGATVDIVFTCQVFRLAPREHDFPRLIDDNPFVGVCEAVLE